ncbi:right-handed parallel beta-helix repeat-containing protein [Hymenobacter sp. BT664]|uniref:Right-handed parallel beta-helix repeat-containing protein n=1 Tax=Hymenobacter montanus TaxID=2771359 RepID=A0A927BH62_9BACT|nr:right-handed parallel beta-helix repeat-containing protein [Hymenobacter montanus]MBD2769983.1 right-handed parallel beta-helix repeat-containing protein [Hymenobacter montanus]
MKHLCLILGGLFAALPNAWAQSSVDESRVTSILHVDNQNPAATPTGPGTAAQPYSSFMAALERAWTQVRAGTGTKLLVHPGTYREGDGNGMSVHGENADTPPLVIEGTVPDRVILSGADVFPQWTPAAGVANCFQTPWTKRWGEIRNPFRTNEPTGMSDLRKEGFYIDGKPLSQVRSAAELRPGRFWVDEDNGRVVLYPPAGMVLAGHVVEGAMRPDNNDFAVLKFYQVKNLVVRKLTVTGCATAFGPGLLFGNSSNVLIEDCHFDRNVGGGLGLPNSQATVRRCTADENGYKGIGGAPVNELLEDVQTNWNGWKSYELGFTNDFDAAGMKLGLARNVTVRRYKSVGNMFAGLWFDVYCQNVTVDQALVAGNRQEGMNWEISDGLTVSRLRSVYNSLGWLSFDGHNVRITNSTIAFNDPGIQVMVSNSGRVGEMISNIPGIETTWRWNVRNSTIGTLNTNNIQLLFDTWPRDYIGTHGGTGSMVEFRDTYQGDNNVFWRPPSNPSIPDAGFREGSEGNPSPTAGSSATLVRWRALPASVQDVNSVWGQPQLLAARQALFTELSTLWREPAPLNLGYHIRPFSPLYPESGPSVVLQTRTAAGLEPLTVYPNPVAAQCTVQFTAAQAGEVRLHLTDITGRTLRARSQTVAAGAQSLSFDVRGLAPGLYVLHLRQGTQTQTQKLVVEP